MVKHPLLIALILLFIEGFVLAAASHPRTKDWFRFLPAVFWIYFLPMIASTLQLIDDKSPLYAGVTTYLLPASLFLLLLGVDLKSITRLGRDALIIFLLGSLGIMIGTAVSFALFRPLVGDAFWMGFGALTASWTGGSANMIAAKEALGTPDDVFLPMVVVDTVLPYAWMALLVAGSTWQGAVDRFNHAESKVLESIKVRLKRMASVNPPAVHWEKVIGMIALALALSLFFKNISGWLPVVSGVISSFTWTIILISAAGLIGSLAPWRQETSQGTNTIGYFILYFVLTTIGAKASLANWETSIILLAAGALIILIHAVVLFITIRWMRAPMMLAAAASQANVGGVASAPIVAEIYQPGLSAIGLLMAILGNVIGTYLGILAGHVCRLFTV